MADPIKVDLSGGPSWLSSHTHTARKLATCRDRHIVGLDRKNSDRGREFRETGRITLSVVHKTFTNLVEIHGETAATVRITRGSAPAQESVDYCAAERTAVQIAEAGFSEAIRLAELAAETEERAPLKARPGLTAAERAVVEGLVPHLYGRTLRAASASVERRNTVETR